ncbi:hypothetical protein FL857_10850 [Criibacterium bergeronii]|uniref:Uncharacterized protein n=1 Tax=Criibacterium bergeronii TaxID=1871336 RepID=A0A552UXL4_9FIRM|nr:hypothetical protein [Criibacterium bergeronii]TRW22900.1 hypothetical protein FL857_10850 [Criibacterium bergeronii]
MKKGVSITFDFEIKSLQKYYSYTSPKNAYKIISDYLLQNGFEKTKDSDYISYNSNKNKSYEILKQFAKSNKWFTPSLTKLAITPINQIWDLSEDYKILYNDEGFIKQKDQEYLKNIKATEKLNTVSTRPSMLKRLSKNKEKLKNQKDNSKEIKTIEKSKNIKKDR